MVTVPNPTTHVLSLIDPETVDQPRPEAPQYGDPADTVAVAEPCPACGCRWVTDPTAVIPAGAVDCGFCGTMRGRVHRNASLTEFEDGDTPAAAAESSIEYRWAGTSPFLGWDEVLLAGRELVRADPTSDYLSELVAVVARPPYLRQVYLADGGSGQEDR